MSKAKHENKTVRKYRIIEITTGMQVAEKEHGSDVSALNWINRLHENGIITGLATQLQRQLVTANETAWEII